MPGTSKADIPDWWKSKLNTIDVSNAQRALMDFMADEGVT